MLKRTGKGKILAALMGSLFLLICASITNAQSRQQDTSRWDRSDYENRMAAAGREAGPYERGWVSERRTVVEERSSTRYDVGEVGYESRTTRNARTGEELRESCYRYGAEVHTPAGPVGVERENCTVERVERTPREGRWDR
jgi:hypothetical protein